MQLALLFFVFSFAKVELSLGYGLPIGSAESALQSETHMEFRVMPINLLKTETGFSAGITHHTGRKDIAYRIDELTSTVISRIYPGVAGDKLGIELYIGLGIAHRYMDGFSEKGTFLVIGAGPSFRVIKMGSREVALYADFSSKPGREKSLSCVESGIRISF